MCTKFSKNPSRGEEMHIAEQTDILRTHRSTQGGLHNTFHWLSPNAKCNNNSNCIKVYQQAFLNEETSNFLVNLLIFPVFFFSGTAHDGNNLQAYHAFTHRRDARTSCRGYSSFSKYKRATLKLRQSGAVWEIGQHQQRHVFA